MSGSDAKVLPIADVPWPDVELVFATRGDPSRCWCQFFKIPNAAWWESSAEEKSALLHEQTTSVDPPPGLIAYLGDEPVGWCAVEPRPAYPRVLTSKVVTLASTEDPDDRTVWAITCFVVRKEFRRQGVSGMLVQAAVRWARDHGARVLEGYPIDTAAKEKVTPAMLYHGSVSLFEAAGFTLAAKPTPGRALMRLEL